LPKTTSQQGAKRSVSICNPEKWYTYTCTKALAQASNSYKIYLNN
jgi:hypothetical protein